MGACGDWTGCACAVGDFHDDENLTSVKKRGRHCTDLPFLAAFVMLWVAMFAVLGLAIDKGGDPQKLLRAVDNTGRICGVSKDVEHLKYGAWPDLMEPDFKVCVDSCNDTTGGNPDSNFRSGFTGFVGYKSIGFAGAYCLPDVSDPDNQVGNIEMPEHFNDASQVLQRYVSDVQEAWWVIVASGFIAMFLAFFFVFLAKSFAGCLVWSSILLILAGFAMATIVLFQEYDEVKNDSNPDTQREKALLGLAVTSGVCTLLFFVFLVLIRKRIRIAIEVVRETSKALLDMKHLVLFPMLPFLVLGLFIVMFVYSLLYLFSVQNETSKEMSDYLKNAGYETPAWKNVPAGHYVDQEWDRSLSNHLWLCLFGFFWVTQFIRFFTYSAMAGAVADWYFTPYENERKRVSSPLLGSIKRLVRYHLGTIAFGSMLIAIVQTIRAFVEYCRQQQKAAEARDQRVIAAIFTCAQCCLKCVQCCLERFTKNAFVFNAVYGAPFCSSGVEAFKLVWANLIRTAAVHFVTDYIAFIGHVFVSIFTAGLAGLIISKSSVRDNITSIFAPTLLCFFIGYAVSQLFMVIFETVVDTIFVCFLIDERENKKSGTMLASPTLVALVDSHAAESKEQARLMKDDDEFEADCSRMGVDSGKGDYADGRRV
ncbi:MAG: hypothetical protein MHM6MM_000542 [Cercozoa sp. M6MM]